MLHDPRRVWWLAFLVSAAATAMAVALLFHVIGGDSISYFMGGWAAPWGIEYRVDALNALLLTLVSGISLVTLIYALRDRGLKTGLATLCLGGGEAVAMSIEMM